MEIERQLSLLKRHGNIREWYQNQTNNMKPIQTNAETIQNEIDFNTNRH
jgi:hypothetical protein